MLTPEGAVRLCADCPNRSWEDIADDSVTGDLVGKRSRYMNANLEFVQGPDETPDTPTQEFGAVFIDTEGHKTAAFLPGVQLEDVAACERPVVSSRSGLLYRKKQIDCGAQVLRLVELRERMKHRDR